MWVQRYRVHCGRATEDYLHWDIFHSEFFGGETKKNATLFVSKAQAIGASKRHKMNTDLRCKTYKIEEVNVQIRKEK